MRALIKADRDLADPRLLQHLRLRILGRRRKPQEGNSRDRDPDH